MANLSKIEDLFREHYTFLCTVADNVVVDEDISKDIVQNFFLYCLDHISALDITSFKSYAFRAVKNAALSYKKRAKKVDYNTELVQQKAKNEHLVCENELEEHESLRNLELWKIIGQMPEKRRLVFLLSNKDGLKYTEIAAQLDISVNTVKTHIKLSYEFLRRECQSLIRILAACILWIYN